MKTNKRHFQALAFMAALTVGTAFAQEMNYQGRLTDEQGDPLDDGQYTLTFSLYDAAVGGNLVWGPFTSDGSTAAVGHGPLVELVDGRFNTAIGPEDEDDDLLADFLTDGDRYLELRVYTNPPITPRQKMLSAPIAMAAKNAMNLSNGKNPVASAEGDYLNIPVKSAMGSAFSLQSDLQNNQLNLLTGVNADGKLNGISFWESSNFAMSLGYDGTGAGDTNALRFYNKDGGPIMNLENGGAIGIPGSLDVVGKITAGTITGTLTTPDLYIPETVGIGIKNPAAKLQVTGGSDASLASNGYLLLGEVTGDNLVLDNNEIMARKDGGVSPLYLQNDGGDVEIGKNSDTVPSNLTVSGTVNGMSAPYTKTLSVTANNKIFWHTISDANVRKYLADAEGGRIRLIATRASDGYIWVIDETVFINPTTGKGYTTQMGGAASAFTLNGDPVIENIIPVPFGFMTIQDQDGLTFGGAVGSVFQDLRLRLLLKGDNLGLGGTLVLKIFDD